MTAFVLVPGAFTGGWVWQEVAERLRGAGAEAYPVTLTGMGGGGEGGHAASPGTDLEVHVQDLLEVIDSLDAADIVIVGHDYGIHPVLGAADRRPRRISRVVYLDTGMPKDGDPPLALAPAGTVPEGAGTDDWRIPPPAAPGEWQRWGSTAGVSEDALARLTRRAAPQPLGTLTEPLRLSGAVAGLPTSGVLCTANGSSIAMVENLLGLGDPRLLALVDPQVTFFELPTGHWPMLSCSDALADALLRAAAGEGHRLRAPDAERPVQEKPFLLDVPEQTRERKGRVDLHLPVGDGPRAAVLFVHGGPVPAGLKPTPRDWPTYVGYAQYVASLGAVGATVDHRLHDLGDYPRAARDVAEAVELLRGDPRVDPDRIALWFFSGGGLLSAYWLAAPPPWLRCVAATYPVLAPLPSWGPVDSRFHPAAAVRTAGDLPLVVTRAGREIPEMAATVEEFLSVAKDCEAGVEVIDVPHGHHGFETQDYTEESRRAVERAVRSVLTHLHH